MKITIYELLGLIKDGKAPKKIKYKGNTYIAKGNGVDGFVGYFDEDDILDYEFIHYVSYKDLNTEIEIIEEVEDKEYEELEELEIQHIEDTQHLIMKDTINALIRNQKYILEQLNKEGK